MFWRRPWTWAVRALGGSGHAAMKLFLNMAGHHMCDHSREPRPPHSSHHGMFWIPMNPVIWRVSVFVWQFQLINGMNPSINGIFGYLMAEFMFWSVNLRPAGCKLPSQGFTDRLMALLAYFVVFLGLPIIYGVQEMSMIFSSSPTIL